MYHFIGIKGSGMASLAVIMKCLGYDVKGSDVSEHFFTEEGLIKYNIPFNEYSKDNIKEDMIIVKGLSIKDDNPEVVEAKRLGLEMYDYNEMVGVLTKKYKTVCVSGCHGKTTTTAMLSHVLNGIKGANYLIGDGTGYANINNELFILESCEYKRHFLAYTPYYTVILNIDLDHVDYFKDINDVILAYQELAEKSMGPIVAYGDDDNVRKMHLDKEIIYFGLKENNKIKATNIEYKKDGSSFDVIIDSKLYGHFNLPLYGRHQVIDALATISICYLEGINYEEVNKYLTTFTGAKRRFTETIINDDVVIDDYAHHPNEIKATINAIKQKYPDKLVVGIFQPHTFTRTKEFYKDYINIFKELNHIYIMDIHPAREKQEDYPDITKDIMIKELPNADSIEIDEYRKLINYHNVVYIFMSPNDISKLENDLINYKSAK